MKKRFVIAAVMAITWFLLLPGFVAAQTTGKISGKITDVKTGEPLPGANVIIKGTQLGGAADAKGDYYIINVPPGAYQLEVRMIGYKAVNLENVRVYVNRTMTADFRLEETLIEGETVTIQADRISIKKDQTNSIRNISSEDIEILPVESVGQVVAMQPGVSGSHFRGGRSNEVVYMIDGMQVTESFNHTSRTVDVNPDAVEDIEVITGTFNAEYGDAMSGVVNIVTKDGGTKFDGSASGNFGNYLTSNKDVFIGLSDSEFDRIQDYKFNISGPVFTDKLTFLLDGRYVDDLGHLNGIYRFNVDDYSDYTAADSTQWHTEHTGDNSFVPMNWHKSKVFFGKLTYKPANAIKLALSTTINEGQGKGYSHGNKYNPYGVGGWNNQSMMVTGYLNHMLSSSAFYEVKLSYNDYQTGGYLYEDPLDSRYVHDGYGRSNGFSTGGQSKGHTKRSEKNLNLKMDFSWQLSKSHFLKTGVDVSQIKLDQNSKSIQNAYRELGLDYVLELNPFTNEYEFLYYEPKIYPDSTAYSDIYKHTPFKFAYYIQDKMEFESMVVNLGVRFDYFTPDATYPTNYRNPANQLYQIEEERRSKFVEADPQYQISPRLGLSYQLGSAALLRFSYGHFLQLPPLTYFYQNNAHLVLPPDFSSRMGNPNLAAQKTIQYEVGLWQQLSNNMNLEIAVWYRDIYELVSATTFTTYDQIRYGVYTNLEYGNARGFEVKYDLRMQNINAGINYTLGYTRGVADNPEMSFNRAGSSMDPVNKMIPMAWDTRHVFNTYVGYNTKKYGTTATFFYNSGDAYTWSPIGQSPLARINLFPNNQHKPERYSVDLNAYYNIAKIYGMDLQVTLLVYNLLDRLNENSVNSNTGRAYQAIITESDLISHRSDYHEYEEQIQNPAMYSTPRIVKLGLGITF